MLNIFKKSNINLSNDSIDVIGKDKKFENKIHRNIEKFSRFQTKLNFAIIIMIFVVLIFFYLTYIGDSFSFESTIFSIRV